jgi:hypothetical protein
MQAKDHARTTRHLTAFVIAAFVLGGCLSEEESAGISGSNTDNTPNNPPANNTPVISGNPATAVLVGDTYLFAPNASDADGDALTFEISNKPAWASFSSATGELSGQPTLGDVGVYQNISISVTDGSASDSLPSFAVSVDQTGTLSTTLSWTAPTENEDGTQLMDLAGYKLYWGTNPGVYTNSVTIDNAGITTYVVDNLAPGTYEFVATAFNASGVESMYSNPATKVLQ